MKWSIEALHIVPSDPCQDVAVSKVNELRVKRATDTPSEHFFAYGRNANTLIKYSVRLEEQQVTDDVFAKMHG
jgi:hypothetical protein